MFITNKKFNKHEKGSDELFVLLVKEIRKNSDAIKSVKDKLDNFNTEDSMSTELMTNAIKDLDLKYKTLFVKLLDYFNIELDLDEEGRIKINNKTKINTIKVGKKNNGVGNKTSKKR